MDPRMNSSNISQQGAATSPTETLQNDSGCKGFIYDSHITPVLYFIIFPLALLLNGVAAWVSIHLKSASTFIVYLKNLVAADIVMTIIAPIKAASDLQSASSDLFALSCRYFSAAFYSTLYTCIALLGLISLDRFFKIMMPHSKLFSNVTLSKVVSVLVWLILFGGSALPNIILSNQSLDNLTQISSCMTLKGEAGLQTHERTVIFLNVFFWLVSVVIAVCYICITNKVIQSFRNSGSNNNQGKQKIKLRVFLVLIVFFVSFGPYHIIRIPYTFAQVSYSSKTSCDYLLGKFAKEISLWFATTNICMNPLLYVFLCREFKEELESLMRRLSIRFCATGKVDSTVPQTRL
ncbi:P2Y purinoceptor 13-like [Xyrichtys novacula]|uniref:P2Y purinoceptor 13-like n=1 Tax=Xyrichtys novacula TaxID=13765 RepID=A0AAV1FWD5_XYRNO|nr:P2Y purinoceptor 13-like [Xyrichtys novacula]